MPGKISIRFYNDREVRTILSDSEKHEGIEVVSSTHDFKFEALDGKNKRH